MLLNVGGGWLCYLIYFGSAVPLNVDYMNYRVKLLSLNSIFHPVKLCLVHALCVASVSRTPVFSRLLQMCVV